jgi:hypothetical protein
MNRICFYTDDSYSPCGQGLRHAVIAGAAISAERMDVRRLLLEAETSSQKGIRDWYHADERAREKYIEAVLDIGNLRGRIFYFPFDGLYTSGYWDARIQTLTRAIAVFTPGDCHHAIFHEGLQGKPRFQLKNDLRERGCERVTVDSAQLIMDPEVRLSDAIAGYVRSELYRGNGERAVLTNIPDWFENLEP